MATTVDPPPGEKYVEFAEYVDFQLQKARRQIKSTDLLTAATVAAVAVVSYLLVFVIFDQWIVRGGLPAWSRAVGLVVWVVSLTAWISFKIVWPWIRSVSGLYAAKEVERAEPALHSNLLNWVDLQGTSRPVDANVLKAIERQAAVQLSKMDVTQAVDHRPLLRSGYALLVVVALFCIYMVVSPKKVGPSLARILPTVDTPAPTRTEIRSVKPGDMHVLARSREEVVVELGGVIPPQVKLLYTTADRKFEDEPITLQPDSEGSTRYRGMLSGENGQGLLQDLTYHIEAGDAISKTYRVTIEQPPSAKATQVHVHPPEYTRLSEEIVQGGNFSGWEGSRVELSAVANMPLKSATVQFLDEPHGKPTGEEEDMTVTDGTQLTATWTLQFRSDGKFPPYFRIHCETSDGRRDPAPLVYQYSIKKDQPPEIVLISPDRDITRPANAIVPLLAEARDPDFELGPVTLHVDHDGHIQRETMFTGGQRGVQLQHELALEPFELKEGDEVTFWLEAQDNRQPRRNRKETPRLHIRIEAPATPQQVKDQLAEQKRQQDQLAEARTDQNLREPPENRPQRENDTKPPPSERQPSEPTEPEPNEPMPRSDRDATANDANDPRNGNAPRDQSAGRERSSSSQPDNDDRKLSPDGEDDQELLQKLHEKLQQADKNGGQQKSTKSGDQQDQSSNPSAPNDSQKQAGETQPSQNGDQPNDKGATDKTAASQQKGTPNAQDGSSGHQSAESSDSKSSPSDNVGTKGSDSAKPKSSPADTNEKPGDKGAEKVGTAAPQDGQSKASEAGANEKPSDDSKSGANKGGNASQKPSEAGLKGNDADPSEKSSKDQPQAGAKSTAGETGAKPSSAKDDSAAAKGDSSEKPQPGDASSQKSTDNVGGPPKSQSSKNDKANLPVADDPSHEKGTPSKPGPTEANQKDMGKPGVGDNSAATPEKNGAKPEQNQGNASKAAAGENAATQSKDAATRPGDAGSKPTSPMNDQPSKSAKADPDHADSPQDGSSEKSPMKSAQETRDGAPGGADEPPKGDGRKDGQRSDQPQQGEAGGSQQSNSGNSGSQQRGPGQSTGRPGEQEAGASNKADGNKSTRAGEKSGQAAGEKDAANQEATGQPSPKEKGSAEQPSSSQPGKSGPSTQEKSGQEGQSSQGQKGPQDGQPKNSQDGQGQGQQGQGQQGQEQAGQGQQGKGEGQQGQGQQGQGQPGQGQQGKGQQGQGQDGQSGQGQQSGGQSGSKAGKGGSQLGPATSRSQGSEGQGGIGGASDPAFNAATGNSDPASAPLGDAANLDFNRQAAELVLQRLKDGLERGDIDPALLKELGWTEDEMQRFVERLGRELNRSDDDNSPEAIARRQQFEEMLKSLDLKRTGAKRTAGNQPQRQVDQVDSRRSSAPAEYRKAWETYTRKLLEQKKPAQ